MAARVLAGQRRYRAYADKIYNTSPVVRAAYSRKNGPLQPWMKTYNHIMSRLRIAVEWSFGKVVTRAKYIAFFMSMRLFEIPVAKYFTVAALLANAHTCMYGTQETRYFDCVAPTLVEYFGQ